MRPVVARLAPAEAEADAAADGLAVPADGARLAGVAEVGADVAADGVPPQPARLKVRSAPPSAIVRRRERVEVTVNGSFQGVGSGDVTVPQGTVAEPDPPHEERDRHRSVTVGIDRLAEARLGGQRRVGIGHEPCLVVGQLDVAVLKRHSIAGRAGYALDREHAAVWFVERHDRAAAGPPCRGRVDQQPVTLADRWLHARLLDGDPPRTGPADRRGLGKRISDEVRKACPPRGSSPRRRSSSRRRRFRRSCRAAPSSRRRRSMP